MGRLAPPSLGRRRRCRPEVHDLYRRLAAALGPLASRVAAFVAVAVSGPMRPRRRLRLCPQVVVVLTQRPEMACVLDDLARGDVHHVSLLVLRQRRVLLDDALPRIPHLVQRRLPAPVEICVLHSTRRCLLPTVCASWRPEDSRRSCPVRLVWSLFWENPAPRFHSKYSSVTPRTEVVRYIQVQLQSGVVVVDSACPLVVAVVRPAPAKRLHLLRALAPVVRVVVAELEPQVFLGAARADDPAVPFVRLVVVDQVCVRRGSLLLRTHVARPFVSCLVWSSLVCCSRKLSWPPAQGRGPPGKKGEQAGDSEEKENERPLAELDFAQLNTTRKHLPQVLFATQGFWLTTTAPPRQTQRRPW